MGRKKYQPMSIPPEMRVAQDTLRHVTQSEDGSGAYQRRLGIYRGFVEFIRDPEQRGRTKVRIPEFSGPEMKLGEGKTEEPSVGSIELPWCEPCLAMGAGKGYGAFSVPTVGSAVFVMYVGGNPDNPVYFGGWNAVPNKQVRYGSTKTTVHPPVIATVDDTGNITDKFAYEPAIPPYWTEEGWKEEQGPDIPREAREQIACQPDVFVTHKTLKGSSFIVTERDTAEQTVITDRLGAELRMEYPTTYESNDDMLNRRNLKSATQHEQMHFDTMFGCEGRTSLFDPVQQGLDIRSNKYGYHRLMVQVHDDSEDNEKAQDVHPNCIRVVLDKGDTALRIEYVEDYIVVGKMEFDLFQRSIVLKGLDRVQIQTADAVDIRASRIRLIGDVEIDGELAMRRNKLVFTGETGSETGSSIRNNRRGFQTMFDAEDDLPPIWEED